MSKRLKFAPLVLAMTAVLLVVAPSFAQSSPAGHGGHEPRRAGQLVGAWRMTSLELGTEGNLHVVPYSGQVEFTKAGTMSVQAMNPDPGAPDTPYTRNGYEAYYGGVTVDRAAGTFTLTVESSLVRDLIGQSLTRNYAVRG